ncbi:hypothetical protein GIW54_24800 [Pseudomonas proteolytica]|uniref:Uncharacterized protein n=1 Tax=Pseudomonas proteolytica TaxID=219574 RepID=A0AAW5AA26_9PSED|nr:hypothetical protein [Pseudomonas proteolytica]MCF5057536.1 hypothetical protein [Pseudomonas proteolytica]MCF5103939.1 hypothetical protein [Pseudomonas proteolytica]
MAQFNIDNSRTLNGRVEWLAIPDAGEPDHDVMSEVRQAAIDKCGTGVFFNHWEHVVASNGHITVRMYA